SFFVVVTPLMSSRNAFNKDGLTVAVFITDPEEAPRPDSQRLGAQFGLTPKESMIAIALMRGKTLIHAAEQLGISHNTARTHLQRIYGKTSTSHQGELLRLLFSMSHTIQIS